MNIKKLLLINALLISMQSVRVCAMAGKINTILTTVNSIFTKVCDLENQSTGGTGEISGLDSLTNAISLLGDVVCSKLEDLITPLESVGCTQISAPTTITMPGDYCLADSIAGSITIDASNVCLNLNGHEVSSGVTINSGFDQVSIKNGTVLGGSPGILAQSGTSNIFIENVTVKNATCGIQLEGVAGGLVDHCTLTQNTTGLELINSHLITIKDTIARQNRHAGFDLLQSTTNCLIECKALSTGEGNTLVTNNLVTGFIATNGRANVFERCIANGSQGLQTTDADSIIAGFTLRGSESCSKIISCEASNAQTSGSGVAVPYGILLQERADTMVTQTGDLLAAQPNSLHWHPNGRYLLASIDTGAPLQTSIVYEYDSVYKTLLKAAVDNQIANINEARWAPDGVYYAVGNDVTPRLSVMAFEQANNSISLIAQPPSSELPTDNVYSVDWRFDGRFLVAGVSRVSDTVGIRLYEFDRVAQTISQVDTVSGSEIPSDDVNMVRWSLDGNYVAAAIINGFVRIYSFTEATKTLNQITIENVAVPNMATSLDWSPDGRFLAVGSDLADTSRLYVYAFDGSNLQLAATPTSVPVNIMYNVQWSADGRYLVSLGLPFNVYEFNGVDTLTLVQTPAAVGGLLRFNLSPDGSAIALGNQSDLDITIYNGFTFPSKNMVSGNTVYCNSTMLNTSTSIGIGVSGSSVSNMITANTVYNNPLNTTFVTNVFNPLFSQAPTQLQNISLDSDTPISAPEDLVLLAKQIKYQVCTVFPSMIDNTVQSVVEVISSAVESPCSPTSISMATTISDPGNYCLANSITTELIAINQDDVTLDLNGYVARSVVVQAGRKNVTIRNGAIDAQQDENGIYVHAQTENITIENVLIKNATRGLYFEQAESGNVTGCAFTQNSTGVQLENSYKITIQNSTAVANTHAGFDLINSSTNCLLDCKALSTGLGNDIVFENTVVGFASKDGYGNIFERCIANATHALSTTDSDSLIAGFALRGSEGCSKIIGCEAANATASSEGVAVPYGILLEGSFDELITVTHDNPGVGTGDGKIVYSVNWSPDGQYLAVGIDSDDAEDDLYIYRFDRASQKLEQIDQADPDDGTGMGASKSVLSVNWSGDGQYLAVGIRSGDSEDDLYIYRFDRASQKLEQIDHANPDDGTGMGANKTVLSVNWSGDGQYLAVGINSGDVEDDLYIYRFDRASQKLEQIDQTNPGTGTSTSKEVLSVNWSGDGQYLAVGIRSGDAEDDLYIYRFDRASEKLEQIDQANPGTGTGIAKAVLSVNWSGDGQYLAVGIDSGDVEDDLYIYRFDRASQKLLEIDHDNPGTGTSTSKRVYSVDWSGDGQYLAVGIDSGDVEDDLYIYRFDRASQKLEQIDQTNPGTGTSANKSVRSIDWSPDGQYLAVGIDSDDSEDDLYIYSGIQFPSKNVIKDNTVYCNGHDVSATFTGAVGAGISGSSISNMIIGNTAYNNPPSTTNFFVPSNYQFVTNVFNSLFGQAPSDLQNISLNGCEPITPPDDLVLLAKQIRYQVCEGIPSFIENLEINACNPAVLVGQTISASGIYCLSQNSDSIFITASNVELDLNNYKVTGSITINSDLENITIKNGRIDATGQENGIYVMPSTHDIVIDNVQVNGAIKGLYFEQIFNAQVSNSSLVLNTTGAQLDNSYKICFEKVTANRNRHAGFDLLQSSTNVFVACKALSTGEGNAVEFENTVAGFVSTDGYGNIFERCIANATQAITTTDDNSLIAGFALRGSEECSKIIGCEAANATASSDGVTVPYGILLEPTFDSLVTVSGFFGTDGEVQALDWSPDGQYLIAGGFGFTGIGDHFQLLFYDRVSNSFTALATVPITTGTVRSVAWSPDGNYVALSGSNITDDAAKQLRVYSFERVTNTLTQIAEFFDDGETIRNVSWNSDGRYLAISGESITSELGEQLQIFELDKINNTMQAVASAFPTNTIYGLEWGPGDYIAVGGLSLLQELGEDLQILQFDRSGPSLAAVAAALGTADSIFAVSWSADGNFVAAGGSSGSNNILKIVQFDAQTPNAQFITEGLGMSGSIQHIDWSPGLDFISVGGGGLTGNEFQVVQFDRNSSSLQEIDAALGTAGTVQGTRWSPDGRFIAVGGGGLSGGIEEELQIFTGFNFPSKNVIKDNTVYCNGHDVSATFTGAVGVGISGSSISNMVIGNNAYNNPFNYMFVTNVFNELFGQAPSDLQNISLDGCTPIIQPDDSGLLALQNQAKACDIQSKVDLLQILMQSLVDNIIP